QPVKRLALLNMRAMSTIGQHLDAMQGRGVYLLSMGHRDHMILYSPDEEQRLREVFKGIAQVDLLLTVAECSVCRGDQSSMSSWHCALLIILLNQRPLDQVGAGEEAC